MCSVQSTVYRVQCAEYSVQSTVQSTVKSTVQHSTQSGRPSQTTLGGSPRPLWEGLPDHTGTSNETWGTLWGHYGDTWETLGDTRGTVMRH